MRYLLTNHICRFCNGRILRESGKQAWSLGWLCANCEQTVKGLSPCGLCWCDRRYADASGDYILRCGRVTTGHSYPIDEEWFLHRPIGAKMVILKKAHHET